MKLAAKLHISEIQQLIIELTTLLESTSQLEVDISEVESVDTASIQALCSLQKSLALTDNQIHWLGDSKAFTKAADTLGVSEFLCLNN